MSTNNSTPPAPNMCALEMLSGRQSMPDSDGRAQPKDTEVLEKPTRRVFTAQYKLDILRRAELCKTPGELGALLRREGLYHSNLKTWRHQRDEGLLQNLQPKKRGPKVQPVEPLIQEIQRLKSLNERLTKKLEQASIIIEAQKKISQLLSIIQEPILKEVL